MKPPKNILKSRESNWNPRKISLQNTFQKIPSRKYLSEKQLATTPFDPRGSKMVSWQKTWVPIQNSQIGEHFPWLLPIMTQSSTLTPPRKTKKLRWSWLSLMFGIPGCLDVSIPRRVRCEPFCAQAPRLQAFCQGTVFICSGNTTNSFQFQATFRHGTMCEEKSYVVALTSCWWLKSSSPVESDSLYPVVTRIFEHPGRILIFQLHRHQHLNWIV